MKKTTYLGAIAMASLAAAGMTAAAGNIRTTDAYIHGGQVNGGQPYHGDAGMAHGTKTRGNRNVKRAAAKARNVRRNRAAHRG